MRNEDQCYYTYTNTYKKKNQIAQDFKVSEGLTMKEVSQVKQVSEHTEVGISAFQRLKTLLSRKLILTMSKTMSKIG